MRDMTNTKRVAEAALLVLTVGCNSTVTTHDDGAGGTGGGGAGECTLPLPGADFSFVVENTGTSQLSLKLGCGSTIPIVLATPDGALGIGPGNANTCEFDCEMVYDGFEAWGCSDCGPGVGEELPPGGEVTITWDRRYYVDHVAPAECSGHEDGNGCGLGLPAEAEHITSGVLTVCDDPYADGYCWGANEIAIPFTIDLTQDSLIIEVP